jgi:hypothetical protein
MNSLFSLLLCLTRVYQDVDMESPHRATRKVQGAERAEGGIMFDTSTVIRAFGFAGQARSNRSQAILSKSVQTAEEDAKADVRRDRPMKDVACYRPEWWEHHNYEPR